MHFESCIRADSYMRPVYNMIESTLMFKSKKTRVGKIIYWNDFILKIVLAL